MNKHKVWIDHQPDTSIELPQTDIDSDQWNGLGEMFNTLIQVNISNREALDQQLNKGNALYEMRAAASSEDEPTPGSPAVMVPLVASVVDEFTSRISGSSLLPRPLLVRGNDPISADNAHIVEQFHNGKYQENKWAKKLRTGIKLAGRDGTSIMGVFWKTKIVERVIRADSPLPDGSMKKVRQRMRITEYDDPELVPIELRDFILFPAYATSINDADGVAVCKYLSEPDLQAMVNSGTLKAEYVEYALSYANTSQGDRSYDERGSSTYTINNRINVVDVSVAPPDGIKMNRGPIRVWQIHTNLVDMDDDGITEENIFWLHDQSHTLLGWEPYEYMSVKRPYFSYSPFERPNRFYGFSIPERTQSFQDESDVQQLTRLSVLDRILNSTYIRAAGIKLPAEDQKTAETNIITVPQGMGKEAINLLPVPEYPTGSMQEQQLMKQMASEMVGAPQAAGIPSPTGESSGTQQGKGSARAAQSQAAIQGMQTNIVLSDTRDWMLEIFEFAHALYRQYGKDQTTVMGDDQGGQKRVTVPREVLSLDYTLGIAGQGGPLDKEKRREEWQVLINILRSSPLFQGNLEREYAALSSILETYEVTEVTRLIGTIDDAKKQQVAQQQAQQQAQQMKLQEDILSHTDLTKAPSGSR